MYAVATASSSRLTCSCEPALYARVDSCVPCCCCWGCVVVSALNMPPPAAGAAGCPKKLELGAAGDAAGVGNRLPNIVPPDAAAEDVLAGMLKLKAPPELAAAEEAPNSPVAPNAGVLFGVPKAGADAPNVPVPNAGVEVDAP